MSEFKLPTYDESSAAINKGEATALQMFIAENEPANGDKEWREQLADVIDEVLFYDRRERAARAAVEEPLVRWSLRTTK